MARFLFTVWPLCGHFHPHVAVAHGLAARGHEVAFYTGARACAVVVKEGFSCFPFKRIDETRLDQILLSPDRRLSWKHPARLLSVFRTWLLDTIPQQVADLEAVLAAWPPDVIVCDVTMWGPPLVLSEVCGVPVAVCSFATGCMIPGPDAPIWGVGLPPPRTQPARSLVRTIEAVTGALAAGPRRRASALRARYGLRPLATSVHEFLGRMPLYLVRGAPEFDYARRDLPPSVHYVGPLVWNRARGEQSHAWLAGLPRDRPWVHVTDGTMRPRATILRSAARGLANLEMQVIMTTGLNGSLAAMAAESLAPNLKVEPWVAHSDLLPHTRAVVTVGGAGTILAALEAGVPLLVVPAESDQPDNARRVVETGAGLRLSGQSCTPRRLRHAVERLLNEPSFRLNAQRLAGVFARYGGATRAAVLLERLAAERRAAA
jgi:MGT family glycosyltransferase